MPNDYSVEALLDFLTHAAERGLLPVATAQALAVASRSVLGMLSKDETADVRTVDLDSVTRRFTNKRARDFSPDTLKEYERRVRKAIALFTSWRDDPANFRATTRATAPGSKQRNRARASEAARRGEPTLDELSDTAASGYRTAFPLRAGHVVTLNNVPEDLTAAEADRLAQFVQMLAIQS